MDLNSIKILEKLNLYIEKCQKNNERINNINYISTMKYYSFLEKVDLDKFEQIEKDIQKNFKILCCIFISLIPISYFLKIKLNLNNNSNLLINSLIITPLSIYEICYLNKLNNSLNLMRIKYYNSVKNFVNNGNIFQVNKDFLLNNNFYSLESSKFSKLIKNKFNA